MSAYADPTPHAEPKAILRDTPCPRCGCHAARHFECFCGGMHRDYCDNCGRWTSLPPTEHTKPSRFDPRCSAGAVAHEHTDAEKKKAHEARFAWVDSLKATTFTCRACGREASVYDLRHEAMAWLEAELLPSEIQWTCAACRSETGETP
jgi:hypothetical protein